VKDFYSVADILLLTNRNSQSSGWKPESKRSSPTHHSTSLHGGLVAAVPRFRGTDLAAEWQVTVIYLARNIPSIRFKSSSVSTPTVSNGVSAT